jgi:hypothetical protein
MFVVLTGIRTFRAPRLSNINKEDCMPVRRYEVKLEGVQPLLMHHDNIEAADQLKAWQTNPANKKLSAPGDDRAPAFSWLGSLYHDGEHITMPELNIMRCIMEGGAQVPVPGGKNGKTFKSQSQSGIQCEEEHWILHVKNKPIDVKPFVVGLASNLDFQKHIAMAHANGFTLFTKRAKIGNSKHIRVRPKFTNWSLKGVLMVIDDQITEGILGSILEYAGRYKGLGDWRPSSPTPGRFGTFDVQSIKEI